MRHNREEDFLAGLGILEPFFEEQDFVLKVNAPVADKEGTTYSAQFVSGNRAVTLVHLFGLGPVTYSIGAFTMDHVSYLEALGVRRDAAYPPFADDSLTGYNALLSDLQTRLMPFFEEPDREFIEIARVHGRERREQAGRG